MGRIGCSTISSWFTAAHRGGALQGRCELLPYQGWAVTALAPGWHQTDTGDWDVSMPRSKLHFFISLFTIPHHARKTRSGYPQVMLPSCPYFPLVQTSYMLGKNFGISAKWLIATVSPDGMEESCWHFYVKIKILNTGTTHLGYLDKKKCCDIQDKASKWLVKDREEKDFPSKMYQSPIVYCSF